MQNKVIKYRRKHSNKMLKKLKKMKLNIDLKERKIIKEII
jgi:hypothetical protein